MTSGLYCMGCSYIVKFAAYPFTDIFHRNDSPASRSFDTFTMRMDCKYEFMLSTPACDTLKPSPIMRSVLGIVEAAESKRRGSLGVSELRLTGGSYPKLLMRGSHECGDLFADVSATSSSTKPSTIFG